MKRNCSSSLGFFVGSALIALSFSSLIAAQSKPATPDSDVITRNITSVGYTVGGGGTKIDLIATLSAQYGGGEAKINAKKGGTDIDVKVTALPQPNTLGPEFLTYVLWSVTPDGSTTNLGEIRVDKNGNGSMQTTAQSQTFALGVTAEPYYAVALPSEVVVLVNDTRKKTQGKIFPENSYKLMKRSQYSLQGNPLALTLDLKSTPLDVYEARNAVEIARSRGAEKYAPEIFTKATGSLAMTEQSLASKSDKKILLTNARQTIQFAEDARAFTAVRQEAERIQREKDAAAAAAKAEADQKAALEARRLAELTAAREAQTKAETERAQAEAQAKADKARLEAESQQAAEQARTQAAKDEAERARAATAAMRAQLLAQLNAVLQTTDSPRGLIVNMADVLFDFGKYDLKPDTKIKLAQLSGIILSHSGLNLAIEGHTDNIGSDEMNMKLSQQRADAVRGYLVQMGLKGETVTAVGLGKAGPVADNSTNAGRQQNRRVEIIVSGEIIGGKL